MHSVATSNVKPNYRSYIFLAIFWIAGLICGAFSTPEGTCSTISSTIAAACDPVSLVGLAAALSFPFIASVLASYFSANCLILLISFLKAFSYSRYSDAVISAFGNAGWLMQLLLLFSSTFTAVPLLWYWCRRLTRGRASFRSDTLLCAACLVLICFVDYSLISPFLALLTQF